MREKDPFPMTFDRFQRLSIMYISTQLPRAASVMDAPDHARTSWGTLTHSRRCLPTGLINHRFVSLIRARGPEPCNYVLFRDLSRFHSFVPRWLDKPFFTPRRFTVRTSSAIFFIRFARGGVNSRTNKESRRSSHAFLLWKRGSLPRMFQNNILLSIAYLSLFLFLSLCSPLFFLTHYLHFLCKRSIFLRSSYLSDNCLKLRKRNARTLYFFTSFSSEAES